MNRVLGAVILVLLLAVAGAYAASPFYAFQQLKTAAQTGDRERLDALVDFPAVRENLKTQVDGEAVKLARKAQDVPYPIATAVGKLGAILGDRAVDKVVTPEGITQIVSAGRAAHGGYKDKNKDKDAGDGKAGPPSTVVHYAYLTPDRFRVAIAPADHPDDQIALLMDRHGLFSWRVEQIELKALKPVDPKDLY
jgi:Protein of unknown function (DUF2939)